MGGIMWRMLCFAAVAAFFRIAGFSNHSQDDVANRGIMTFV
jgi:hypothetical protein